MAKNDLRGFSARIKVIGKMVAVNADKAVRATALAVDTLVVNATPVDTGAARVNWQPSINEPMTGVLPAPIDADGAANEAIAAMQDVAKKYNGDKGSRSIYIANNLPYIKELDRGSSTQAPAGFVAMAVRQGVEAIRNSKLIVPPEKIK